MCLKAYPRKSPTSLFNSGSKSTSANGVRMSSCLAPGCTMAMRAPRLSCNVRPMVLQYLLVLTALRHAR